MPGNSTLDHKLAVAIVDARPLQFCEEGKFSASNASTACSLCPLGQFQVRPGSTLCEQCSAGSVAPSLASTSCLQCSPGKYGPDSGRSLACLDCPAGTDQ